MSTLKAARCMDLTVIDTRDVCLFGDEQWSITITRAVLKMRLS